MQRCTGCGGIFCSPQALVELKTAWKAEVALDSGDPKLGRSFDVVDDLSCPGCGATMDKVADPRQTHIWFEQCPTCDGMFFDAGELRDLKHETFLDRVRGLLRGRRPS